MQIKRMLVKEFLEKIAQGEKIYNAYYIFNNNYYNIECVEINMDGTIYLKEADSEGLEFDRLESIFIIENE